MQMNGIMTDSKSAMKWTSTHLTTILELFGGQLRKSAIVLSGLEMKHGTRNGSAFKSDLQGRGEGMNAHLLSIQCRMYALVAEVEGMRAENEFRLASGQQVAFTEQNFAYISSELNALSAEAQNA